MLTDRKQRFDAAGDNTVKLTLHVSPALRNAVVRAAQAKGISNGSWWRGAALATLTKEGISL